MENYGRASSLGGWVSLPVILLLLLMITLQSAFSQRLNLMRSRFYQEHLIQSEEYIWSAYYFDRVINLRAESALQAECGEFCPALRNLNWTQSYVWRGQTLYERWEYQEVDQKRHFRLCAMHQARGAMRCWWFQYKADQLVPVGYLNRME